MILLAIANEIQSASTDRIAITIKYEYVDQENLATEVYHLV